MALRGIQYLYPDTTFHRKIDKENMKNMSISDLNPVKTTHAVFPQSGSRCMEKLLIPYIP